MTRARSPGCEWTTHHPAQDTVCTKNFILAGSSSRSFLPVLSEFVYARFSHNQKHPLLMLLITIGLPLHSPKDRAT